MVRKIFKLYRSSSAKVFGEGISYGYGGKHQLPYVYSPRWFILLIVLAIFSLFGTARLVDLELIRGSYFHALAEGNRIRHIPLRAARGEILDREGRALARNTPVYELATFSSGGIVVKTDEITREKALEIQANDSEAGSRLLIGIKREYPLGAAAAHLVGYVNEVSPNEVGKSPEGCPESSSYILGDLVGRSGIEAYYQCELRGTDGEELIEVDTKGKFVRSLGRRDPIPGKDIKISVDARLQQEAYNDLLQAPNEEGTAPLAESGKAVRGALVLENPQNGEVLALVSVPSFDPSSISKDYSELAGNQDLPLFNRAISGTYHPGSTFKIITSIAGLEDGKIDRDYQYNDTGKITVNNFSYTNWYFTQYGRTEGLINIVRAIARSTDTFFYNLGGMVGVDRLDYWASKFGFGKKTGIDLFGEASGLLPSPDWKIKTKGERWFLGNTYHFAIGQGDLLATPLQVAAETSAIASGGKYCKSKLLFDQSPDCQDLGIKEDNLKTVEQGMVGVCSNGGTAFPFFNFKISSLPEVSVACKTGTAQTIKEKTHAWFTAFAPFSLTQEDIKPSIVATAVIEDGGEGSTVAAPVVKKVFDYWFNSRNN